MTESYEGTTTGENKVPPRRYRFEIFKGDLGSDGVVRRVRTVGSAFLTEGMKTYVVHLKSLLVDTFYLLPEEKRKRSAKHVSMIAVRVATVRDPRKPRCRLSPLQTGSLG